LQARIEFPLKAEWHNSLNSEERPLSPPEAISNKEEEIKLQFQ
jgi:hypothetical protein